MNCKAVQSRLSAYLDRELSGDELLQLRAHLSDCVECRNEEAELRNLKLLLGNLSAPEPSPDFANRLCATVLRQPQRTESRWTLRRAVVTFAGVAACSMLATFAVFSLRAPAEATIGDHDLALDVVRDQAYDVGLNPTEGASMISVANYASSR